MKDWTENNNLYVCNHRTKDSMVAAYDLYCTHPDSIAMFIWDNSYDGLPEIDWI